MTCTFFATLPVHSLFWCLISCCAPSTYSYYMLKFDWKGFYEINSKKDPVCLSHFFSVSCKTLAFLLLERCYEDNTIINTVDWLWWSFAVFVFQLNEPNMNSIQQCGTLASSHSHVSVTSDGNITNRKEASVMTATAPRLIWGRLGKRF